jgi:hypothetical protein
MLFRMVDVLAWGKINETPGVGEGRFARVVAGFAVSGAVAQA